MSGLNQAVEDYLTTRRALGFKLERHGRLLPHLVGYLERAGAATVTTELALAWATQSEGHPDESAKRLSVARGFARYLQTLDSNAEVPAADLLARQQRRASPYLYSDADVVALMAATSTLRFPLRSATYRTLIGLLAVTGMRVGEAIGLVRDDLDWSHRRLIIREGKFGASRELPLHPSTIDALEMYAQLRDQCWPQPRSPFFISMAGTRLIHENVHLDLPTPGAPRRPPAPLRFLPASDPRPAPHLRGQHPDRLVPVWRGCRGLDASVVDLSRTRRSGLDVLVLVRHSRVAVPRRRTPRPIRKAPSMSSLALNSTWTIWTPRSSAPSWTTSRPSGAMLCPPATSASPPCIPCSALLRSSTPSTLR